MSWEIKTSRPCELFVCDGMRQHRLPTNHLIQNCPISAAACMADFLHQIIIHAECITNVPLSTYAFRDMLLRLLIPFERLPISLNECTTLER